ncbi:MAG: S9 family peptidase [Halieaceae bacterium]|jgi:dipeptidyl aminopeptidase/acylaminoacyl peptidase|nr:S9 family peptidase [Halieaceae bacterium]
MRFHTLLLAALALNVSPVASAQEDAETGARVFHPEDVFRLEYAADPQISADGSTIAYVRRSADIMVDRFRGALWLVDVKTGDHSPLVADDGSYSSPRWSPDDDRLAFLSSDGGQHQINVHWLASGRSAVIARLTERPAHLSWSPDGRWLAFTMQVAAAREPLARAPAKPEGASWAEPVKLIDTVRYKRDGSGFVEPAHRHVFVVPADGGAPRQLTSGEFDHTGPLSWGPASSRIYFSANRHADWEYESIEGDIFSVDVADGRLEQITDFPGREAQPAVSPNGRRIAYVKASDARQPYRRGVLEVINVDGTDRRALTRDLDRSVNDPTWAEDGSAIYVHYDDRAVRKVARVATSGSREVLAESLGGSTIGRPYTSGAWSVAADGSLAFTRGSAHRPADLWVRSGGSERQLTSLNEELLQHRDLGEVHEIVYESGFDGLEIQGWYITPPGYDPSKSYPAILEIHGGPHLSYGPNFAAELQLMAARGYVVFYDNHRGSTSYGEEFALKLQYKYSSEEDFADHMAGLDALVERGIADPDRLFITGGSAGGIATAYAIGLTDRFRAAAVAKPVINWVSKVLTADSYVYQIPNQFPGTPWDELEHYWKRSPLSLVGNVTTPTLLITGEEDQRTPISETEQFYQALKLRRVDTVMIRVPGSPHGIAGRPSRLIAKVNNILAWFEKYSGPG